MQTPPAYSAVKLDGERAYRAARRGEQPQLEPRPVTVYALELLEAALPDLELEVECSKGFYLRSLAHDVGRALGVGGHLAALCRTAGGAVLDRGRGAARRRGVRARGGRDRGPRACAGRGAGGVAGGDPRPSSGRAGAPGTRHAPAAVRRRAAAARGRASPRLRARWAARGAARVRADPRRLAPVPGCFRPEPAARSGETSSRCAV